MARRREQQKAYRVANPEKYRARARKRYAADPEKSLSARRKWYVANRDEYLARLRSEYPAKAEEERARRKAYREANLELERERDRKFEEENREKRRAKNAKYDAENRDKRNAYRKAHPNQEYLAAWEKAARPKRKARHHERQATDVIYRIRRALRGRLTQALKKGYKQTSAVTALGCSIEFLKEQLESKFQPGMTWENYGMYGWHIDHIRELVLFDLTDPKEVEKACHYTNLQPLWRRDNIVKGSGARWLRRKNGVESSAAVE